MTSARLKVLILGGYGTFGGRLAQLLADEDRLTLVIAGRSKARAEEFCVRISAKAEFTATVFDRDGDVEAQLALLKPDIVVDASGPFQAYGDDPYRVVRAATAQGIHYLDLADGSEFVRGIAQFNAAARERGLFVLSGVSTVPVLTAAAVRRLARGFPPIETIEGGLAISPYANLGLSVTRAVASYAGKPVALFRDGIRAMGFALTDSRRRTISPPGTLGLKCRQFSLVDVPDLTLFPERWPGVRSVWFGAGLMPGLHHRVLNAFAWFVRLKLLPSLSTFAPLMHWLSIGLRWGEHRSGLYVRIAGKRGDGARVERSWHLVAEGDDGPFIPSMPAAIIIRRCLGGNAPAVGARPALDEVELEDYEAIFAQLKIMSGVREAMPETERLPVYRCLLGSAWEALPKPLQDIHNLSGPLVAEGRATVERGGGMLARLVAAIIGFPEAGSDIPVKVHFAVSQGREYWRRTFAGRTFSSTQEEGRGRFEYLLCERFGPCVFGLALVIDRGRLRLVLRRWSFLGLPLPVFWAPNGEGYEHAENGRFNFHVEISHPFTGPIVKYRGWLAPELGASDKARQEPSNPALVGVP